MRNKTSGLAERTLKNLKAIEQCKEAGKEVHLVTQVLNSLLALLVFPVEREQAFFQPWELMLLQSALNPTENEKLEIKRTLDQVVLLPSLEIVNFKRCPNVAQFFKRIRNALSHKNIEFDSDSPNLAAVTITLRDKRPNENVDWQIAMTAADLRSIGVSLGEKIVREKS